MIKEYRIEISLSCAFIWVLISLFLTGNDGNLLSRSGSVMVLLAVFAEFQLSSIKDNSIKIGPIGWGGVAPTTKAELPPRYKKLAIVSHLEIILGTLVWGYGDLAFRFLTSDGI